MSHDGFARVMRLWTRELILDAGAGEERVAIVASGPSLRGVDLTIPDGITVIAVNAAIDHVSRADYWFTSDPTGANVGILERRAEWPDTVFEVALPKAEQTLPYEGITYIDRLDKLWVYNERSTIPPGNPTLCVIPNTTHHGNSAWGALQRAYQRGMKRGILLGVDATGDGYAWGNGRPRDNLAHLPFLFRSALPQLQREGIEVVNGSLHSRVTCFPRTTPEAAIDWLRNPDNALYAVRPESTDADRSA